MIVPLDRDGIKVRPIALTEALAKLAQGTLMERTQRKLRKDAEPSKTKSEGKASTAHRTILGANANGSGSPRKNRARMSERQTHRDIGSG